MLIDPTIEPGVTRRLRVLVVSPYFPFPTTSGVTMRIYQVTREIAARHDVTFLSYATSEDDAGIRKLGESFPVRVVYRREPRGLARRVGQLRSLGTLEPFASQELRSAEMQAAIDDLCRATQFDLIHVESSRMCCFDFPAGVPVVVDEHNVEYELFRRLARGERSYARRAFNGLEYLRVRRFEQRCWNEAQGCVVTSSREEPSVRAAAPSTPTAVVPNGVDLEFFAPSSDAPRPNTVVFTGTLEYRPNVDAVTHLVDEVWPRVLAGCPSARLTIVGSAPEEEAQRLRRPSVDIVGRVPDVRPFLAAAAVVAVPVRMGGGTRLKVVEALAMAKPMVSTSLGCEGLAVTDRRHVLIADDADTFAAAILQLLADPELGRRLGQAGRALAQDRYSWHLCGDQLDAHYREVLRGSAAPPVSSPEPATV